MIFCQCKFEQEFFRLSVEFLKHRQAIMTGICGVRGLPFDLRFSLLAELDILIELKLLCGEQYT